MCHLTRLYTGTETATARMVVPARRLKADKTFIGGHDEAGHDDRVIVMGVAEAGRDLLRTKHHLPQHIVRFVKKGSPTQTFSVVGSPGRIGG